MKYLAIFYLTLFMSINSFGQNNPESQYSTNQITLEEQDYYLIFSCLVNSLASGKSAEEYLTEKWDQSQSRIRPVRLP